VQKISILLSVDKFLTEAAPEKLAEIMSPSNKAVELSKKLQPIFTIKG